MKSKVCVVGCNDYSLKKVENAVRESLKLIGYEVPKGKRILIKPNILGVFPIHKRVTTDPSVIEAVVKIFSGNKIYIGDSSFTATEAAFRSSGVERVARKHHAAVVDFDKEKPKRHEDAKIKYAPVVLLPEIYGKMDMTINLPKMKTHAFAGYTGAIKNTFGFVNGDRKRMIHKAYNNVKEFSRYIVGLYEHVSKKPMLTIMDAVWGMEGNGPSAGNPKKTNLILASENAAALDVVACDIMGYGRDDVMTNVLARKKGLADDIEILGKKDVHVDYKKPNTSTARVLFSLYNKVIPISRITVNEKKCIQCGLCAKHCPAKAMVLLPYPHVNRNKCIRCFCCMEVCPKHALYLKESKIEKMATSFLSKR